MEETKFMERIVKALPIIAGFAAIVAPTSVSIAIFFSVLIMNNSVRAELAAHGAMLAEQNKAIDTHGMAIERLRAEVNAQFLAIGEDIDALSADVVELKIGYAEVSARLDSLEVRLAAVERRLPDVEYVDGRFDDLEREVEVLKERVAALARAGGE